MRLRTAPLPTVQEGRGRGLVRVGPRKPGSERACSWGVWMGANRGKTMINRTLGILLLLMLPQIAAAQSDARFSAGVGVTYFESSGKLRLSPVLRGRPHGFGLSFGADWFNTDVVLGSGGFAARGDLRVRPLMLGPSYTFIRGRLSTTAAVLGGYSFNSISSMAPTAGTPVELRVENSLALAPTVTLGLDLTRKLGLVTRASYLVTRPQVTASSAGQETRSRWRADTLVVQAGIVVGLF